MTTNLVSLANRAAQETNIFINFQLAVTGSDFHQLERFRPRHITWSFIVVIDSKFPKCYNRFRLLKVADREQELYQRTNNSTQLQVEIVWWNKQNSRLFLSCSRYERAGFRRLHWHSVLFRVLLLMLLDATIPIPGYFKAYGRRRWASSDMYKENQSREREKTWGTELKV